MYEYKPVFKNHISYRNGRREYINSLTFITYNKPNRTNNINMDIAIIVINSVVWGSLGLSWLISEIREEVREDIRREVREGQKPFESVSDTKLFDDHSLI